MTATLWLNRLAPHALTIAIGLLVVGCALIEPAFLKPENLIGILRSVVLVGIMAVCMTFVIMTGGIDLSVGPVLALSGVVAFFVLDGGWGLPLAVLAGLTLGVAVGLLNGVVIAFMELPAVIVTLATLSVVRGSALMIGGPDLHSIRDQPAYAFIGTGTLLGLSFSIYLFAALAAVMVGVQRLTPVGICVTAIGENQRAAYLSGHHTRLTKALLYGVSSFGAALAGIIQSSQVHTASATYGEFGTELDVIAAVVLGGANLMGGAGSILRTLLGVMFLGVLNNAMNILNMPIDIQLIAKGIVIALSLAVAQRR